MLLQKGCIADCLIGSCYTLTIAYHCNPNHLLVTLEYWILLDSVKRHSNFFFCNQINQTLIIPEYFTLNSFEQLCINYTNEKFHKFCIDIVLKYEQELYIREGLNVPVTQFLENQNILGNFECNISELNNATFDIFLSDLFESKYNIFSLLDEETKLPKPSSASFTNNLHSAWKDHSQLSVPRALRSHRTLRDEEGFIIKHFAGDVCYTTVGLI